MVKVSHGEILDSIAGLTLEPKMDQGERVDTADDYTQCDDHGLIVDIYDLIKTNAQFRKLIQKASFLDFNNPEHLRAYSNAVLKENFKCAITLPDDRLIPPVPNRYLYVQWIQSLLDETSTEYNDLPKPEREIVGIDVGVGANLIYPILAVRSRPNWVMHGTETDDKSFEYAKRNLELNRPRLGDRVKLHQVKDWGPLLPLSKIGIEKADFVMCNPPFYMDRNDMLVCEWGKDAPPPTACTGSDSEMLCPGGELEFAMRMLRESRELGDRVQWYSVMFGLKKDVAPLCAAIREAGITNYAVTTLKPGKTVRYCVAWSLMNRRPSEKCARPPYEGLFKPSTYAAPTLARIHVPSIGPFSLAEASRILKKFLDDIYVSLKWQETLGTGLKEAVVFAPQEVWVRRARRALTRGQLWLKQAEPETHSEYPLVVRITPSLDGTELNARYLQGSESKLFESFWAAIQAKIEQTFNALKGDQRANIAEQHRQLKAAIQKGDVDPQQLEVTAKETAKEKLPRLTKQRDDEMDISDSEKDTGVDPRIAALLAPFPKLYPSKQETKDGKMQITMDPRFATFMKEQTLMKARDRAMKEKTAALKG